MKYYHSLIILLVCLGQAFATESGDVATWLSGDMPNIEVMDGVVKTLRAQGDMLYEKEEYDKALPYYLRARDIVTYYGKEEAYSTIHYDLGYTYYDQHNYTESVKSFNEYLLFCPDMKPQRKARVLKKLAAATGILGNAEQSYQYQLLNLAIREDLKDTVEIAGANYELGSIMYFQEEYIQAREYYSKALELNYVIRDSFTIFACLSAIGGVANREGDLESAMEYHSRALAIAEAKNYQTGLAYAYHNLSADYQDMGNLEKALEYNFKSLEIKQKQNDPFGISNNYRGIGKLYIRMGNLEQAEVYLERSLKIAEEINSTPRLADAYEALSLLKAEQGKYDEAYHFIQKYREESDSMKDKASFHKMKVAALSYEVNKRDKEILSLHNERKMQRLKLMAGSGILVLVLLLMVVLAMAYRKMRSVNRLLAEKQVLIKEQNAALERSNKDLEQFAYVASHDMRAPIRTISAFNKLLRRKYADRLDTNGLEFLDFIGDAAQRLDLLLTDLLDYSRVNTRNNNKEPLDMADVVMLAANNLRSKIDETDAEVTVDEMPTSVLGNRIQLVRLLQNLISNGIKYNDKEKKRIVVGYDEEEGRHVFSVKDNGIGIAKEFQKEIFEIFRRLHSVSEYEGSGIGLATCKKIVNRHNGEMWVESEIGKGTTIFFALPKKNEGEPPVGSGKKNHALKPLGKKRLINRSVHSVAS